MTNANNSRRLVSRLMLAAAPAALAVASMPAAAQVSSGPGATLNAGVINTQSTGNGTGGASFTGHIAANTGAAETSTITLGSNRTLLNWGGFNLSSGDTLNFVFGANTDIVLNRVNAGAATISGALRGNIGSTAGATGGNLWFLANGGILVNSTGTVNVGGLLFSTGQMTDSNFFGGNYAFVDAANAISVASGANLTAANGAITLMAPSISFGGTAVSSGSIGLIGATDAQIVFDGDLDAYVGLTISEGSSQSTGISVTEAASFDAAAVASGGRTVLVAAGNGTSFGSIMLEGVSANRVEFVEGDVVIYAAGSVPAAGAPRSIVSGGVLQGLGSATGSGVVSIGAANVSAGNLNTIAVDDVTVLQALNVSGNARFEAGDTLTITPSVVTGGDYTVRADDFGSGLNFSPTEGGDINIEDTAGGLTIGNVTATDDLRITTTSGDLTITGGAVTATGGSIFLNANGDLNLQSAVTDTGADDNMSLVAGGAINQTAGIITTNILSGSAGTSASLLSQNLVGGVGGFVTGTGFLLGDEDGLVVSGDVIGGTGQIILNTSDTGVGTAADLFINANVTTTGANVALAAEGTLTVVGSIVGSLVGGAGAGTTNLSGAGITLNGASVRSGTGGANLFAPVTLTTNTSNSIISGGNATLNGTINGAGALSVTSPGVTNFNGVIGGTTALVSIGTDSPGSTRLTGNVTTTGAQSFGGAITLAGATTLTSGALGAIDLGSVDGAHALTINTANVATLGTVGATTALTSLTTNAGGNTVLAGNVTTSGNQSYGDATNLTGNLTSTAGSVSVGNTLTLIGAGIRKVTARGATFQTVNSAIFNTTGLSVDVSSNPTGAVGFTGSIIVPSLAIRANTVSLPTGGQSVGTLAANITGGGFALTTSGSTSVGTVDGLVGVTTGSGQNISIASTSGSISLAAPVTTSGTGDVTLDTISSGSITGSGLISGDHLLMQARTGIGTSTTRVQTAVNSLTAAGGDDPLFIAEANAITLRDTSIVGCGGTCLYQNFGETYDLTAGGTITASDMVWAGGSVTLTSTGGDIVLAGGAGTNNIAPSSAAARLTAAGSIDNVNGARITGQDIFLSAGNWLGNIFSASVLQETNNLSITDTAGGFDAGAFSAANNLAISANGGLNINGTLGAGGSISLATTGANSGLNINGALTNSSAINLTTTGVGSNIAINAGVTTGTSLNSHIVSINATGAVSQSAAGIVTAAILNGSAGGAFDLNTATNAIGNLGAVTANGIQILDAGNLSVIGAQAGGASGVDIVTAGGLGIQAQIGSSGNITLAGTGAGGSVAVGGNILGTGTSGISITSNVIGLEGITVQGGTGGVSLTGAVDLYNPANIVTSGANATFSSTVNGLSGLTVNASGITSFGGVVGGTQALASLTTDTAGSTTLNGNVSTTGAQTFNDAVNLGAATTLASSGDAAITLGGTVNGARALTVNTAGATSFGGNVGATVALTTLTTNAGGTTAINGNVTTSGNQSYGDAATLAGNVTSTLGNATFGALTLTGTGTRSVSGAALTFGSVNATGGVSAFQATSSGNLTISGTTNAAEVALSAGGTITTDSIAARDDIALRGVGSVTTGALSSGTTVNAAAPIDFAGPADTLAAVTLTGNDVDAIAGTGTTPVAGTKLLTGAVRANGTGSDARLSGFSGVGNGAVDLDIATGGNIVLTGSAGGRDVALLAGGAVTTARVSARDDIVIRATGGATSTELHAGVTVDALAAVDDAGTGAGDVLAGATLAGADVDAVANGVVSRLIFAAATGSDVRLNGGAAGIGNGAQDLEINSAQNISLSGAGGTRGRDVAILAANGSLTAGAISARDDAFVRSSFGTVTVGTVTAGMTIDSLAALDVAGIADTYASATLAGNDVVMRGIGVVANGQLRSIGADSDVSVTTFADGLGLAGTDLNISADGNVAVTGTARGRDVTLAAGSTLSATAVEVARDYSVQAQSFTGGILAPAFGVGGDDFTIVDIAGGLTLGSAITAPGALTVNVQNGGGLTVDAALASTNEGVTLTSGGTLSIGAAGGVTGGDVVLATDGAFVNQSGADALVARTGGHWVVYSAAPGGNSFGGLDSGNSARWNATLATVAPASISGNRYAFAAQPTVTLTTIDASKTYGTDLSGSTGTLYAVSGLQAGVANAYLADTAATAFSGAPSITSGGFAERASVAGAPYAIDIATGTLLGENGYAVAVAGGGQLTITPKALNGTAAANSKIYDGGTAGIGSIALSGVVAGDTVGAGGTFTFADKNAGTDKTVTISGAGLSGADAGNYTLTVPASTLADILQKAISGAATADNKIYDGGTAATGNIALSGVVAGDSVGVGGTFTFADKNAGTGKTVTISGAGLSGADAGNYTLTVPASVLADIAQKAITGTATADGKIYDGGTAATGSIALSGVIAGDTVGASGTFTYADKNAGTAKAVTVSGIALNGADGGNYTLTVPASVLADILPKALAGTAAANNKTYDGTTAATGSIGLDGVVAGDSVSASGSFAFADKNAGAGKTVAVSGVALSGADAGNYSLIVPTSAVADILQKALTGTVSVADKIYDGTTAATGNVALAGVVAGDAVGAGAIFAFADANAGPTKTVTVSGASLSGADAANYTVTVPGSAVAAILRRAITVSANPASKTAGQADPALTYAISAGALVSGETLTGALGRAAGEGAGGYAIQQGTLAASQNYQLSFVGNTLTILPAPVTGEPSAPIVTSREDWDGFLRYIASITPPNAEAPALLIIDEREDCAAGSGGANGECVATSSGS